MLPETPSDPYSLDEPFLTSEKEATDAPDSVNWVTKNCVTPPQNQGKCGGCYAFAATAAVESSYCISSGELLKLSEQQLIDCQGEEFQSHGCNGGSSFLAFDYLTQAGQELESVYPYASQVSGEPTACTYSSD